MRLRANVKDVHAPPVVEDLLERGAAIEDSEQAYGRCVVRATGRLRTLLGYPHALALLSDKSADVVMWLSHYIDASSNDTTPVSELRSGKPRSRRRRRPAVTPTRISTATCSTLHG
jgi:hypothetical protein